jgi:hypothetical protein
MKMGFYKLSILSSALSHLIQIVKNPENIYGITCKRNWSIEEKSRKVHKDVPFLYNKIKTIKYVKLDKRSLQPFEYKKVLRALVEEDVGDMVVTYFCLLVRNGILKEIFEKLINEEVVDDRFVLYFVRDMKAGKEDRTRRQIASNMEIQIKNYDFKVASLDLVGIYAYQDYVKDRQFNILEQLKNNDKVLREIADVYFKEFIKIQGVQKRIRAIKYYEIGKRNMPILKEIKVF